MHVRIYIQSVSRLIAEEKGEGICLGKGKARLLTLKLAEHAVDGAGAAAAAHGDVELVRVLVLFGHLDEFICLSR